MKLCASKNCFGAISVYLVHFQSRSIVVTVVLPGLLATCEHEVLARTRSSLYVKATTYTLIPYCSTHGRNSQALIQRPPAHIHLTSRQASSSNHEVLRIRPDTFLLRARIYVDNLSTPLTNHCSFFTAIISLLRSGQSMSSSLPFLASPAPGLLLRCLLPLPLPPFCSGRGLTKA